MTKPTTQIGDIAREMTDLEFAQHEKDAENDQLLQQAIAQIDTARASALAKLAGLGLTADEIAALVGA